METELKSWENVSEFITLMNERFVDLYNSKIVYTDVYQEDESILESYEVYMANAIQKLVPSLIVVMFQNGSYGYLTKNIVFDFYGNPVYEQKYTIIPDMEFERIQGDTIGKCDPLRNKVWNTLENDLLQDGAILLETVKHRSFERKTVLN